MSRKKKQPRRAAASRAGFEVQAKAAVAVPRGGLRKWLGLSAAALLVTTGALLYALFGRQVPAAPTVASSGAPAVPDASYVGSRACVACHANEYGAWKGSDHALAMQHAEPSSVLGNFDNSKFVYGGITSRFFKRDGKYLINTDGPDGRLHDYEIKYTFGVRPLQQYLVEFPNGRIQPLAIAWDARPAQQGGQHWFHLYPQERITYRDELHWTQPAQNWNFMCADCHSTELRKKYDPVSDRFRTRWSEINVGCEACHGPGSEHLNWTKSQKAGRSAATRAKGLTVKLDERRDVTWNRNAANGNAVRSRSRLSEREIEVCAQCHARRGQIAEGYKPGKPFLDYYRPALLTSPFYHADGQQRDEVYIWGSFLQSKMSARGVTCSDCHNPHSGKLRAVGNTVCAGCHLSSKYDTAAHHHHKVGSDGAACAGCHMPTTTYMVVDPRHDHSLRVPRPDLSVKLGTPNACSGCHSNRDARWATAQVNQWYGHNPQGYQGFAAAFAAANAGALDGQAQLRAIAADASQPAIARATALTQFNAPLRQNALDLLAKALSDPSPLIRLGALQSLAGTPAESRVQFAAPLLSDPLRAIRLEAVSLLAPVPPDRLSAVQRDDFARASAEYIASQQYNSDRAESRLNLGAFYANRGEAAKGEAQIKAAIALDPHFIPAYVNLADLFRAHGGDTESASVLRDGLTIAPKNAMLHHALGLALVRLKRADAALAEFEQATRLEPANARFSYVYAVALHSTGKPDLAIAKLERAFLDHPSDRDIIAALASFHQARGDVAAAEKFAERLKTLDAQMPNPE